MEAEAQILVHVLYETLIFLALGSRIPSDPAWIPRAFLRHVPRETQDSLLGQEIGSRRIPRRIPRKLEDVLHESPTFGEHPDSYYNTK